jgi:hypothetical protein
MLKCQKINWALQNKKRKEDMLNERELRERRAAFDNAIGNQHLEGLQPDAETIDDLSLVVNGELTLDDAYVRLHARVACR